MESSPIKPVNLKGPVVIVGTGLTTFLLVAALVSYVAEPYIAFSVFIGIPIGFVAGLGAIDATYYLFERNQNETFRQLCAAVAGFGYTIIALSGSCRTPGNPTGTTAERHPDTRTVLRRRCLRLPAATA